MTYGEETLKDKTENSDDPAASLAATLLGKADSGEAPRRRKRQSHGMARYRLSVPQEVPGHYIRWCNDDGREVEWRLQSDYEFVAPAEVGLTDVTESRVKRLVGVKENGDPLFAYLMKIRSEWRAEDEREEAEMQARIEQQIKGGVIANPGEDVSTRYIPKGGISLKHGRS